MISDGFFEILLLWLNLFVVLATVSNEIIHGYLKYNMHSVHSSTSLRLFEYFAFPIAEMSSKKNSLKSGKNINLPTPKFSVEPHKDGNLGMILPDQKQMVSWIEIKSLINGNFSGLMWSYDIMSVLIVSLKKKFLIKIILRIVLTSNSEIYIFAL